jgi:hypothetical protein
MRSLFSDDELGAISTFEDAARLLVEHGVSVESYSDYGTGFALVPDKDKGTLVGVGFIVLRWRFNDEGDFGTFVSAEIVTAHNEKYVLNDGSTGICAQLQAVTDKRIADGHPQPWAGLVVKDGLRRSDYFFNSKTGDKANKPGEHPKDWAPASTYYLAN